MCKVLALTLTPTLATAAVATTARAHSTSAQGMRTKSIPVMVDAA